MGFLNKFAKKAKTNSVSSRKSYCNHFDFSTMTLKNKVKVRVGYLGRFECNRCSKTVYRSMEK